MNTDDMVFGEISYREPVRLRRPDRDRRWACVPYEVVGPGDMPIFLDRKPADAIERHALRDVSVELGGILLGHECIDDLTGEPFVWITESVEAKHYENTEASFTYTHDSWQEITRERDRLHPNLNIVGWYHTHPDFGIFLSGHDLFIHQNFFDQPLQVAYVVDPIRQTRGFFRWKTGGLDQVGGYYLVAERAERSALAGFVNDLEGLPNAGVGGGSGLSPRLEAELIAMLTRPSAYQAPPRASDQRLPAALGSLMGLFVGLLVVAVVLWINTLHSQLHGYAVKLDKLETAVTENAKLQSMALDALLPKSKSGDPDAFSKAYQAALEDRDRAKLKADNLTFINEELAGTTKKLQEDSAALRRRLAVVEFEAKANAAAAKLTESVQADLAKAESKLVDQSAKLAHTEEVLGATDAEKAASLVRQAKWSLYLAVGGWVVAVLLGVGLVALWAFGPTKADSDPATDTPHVIM